MLETLATETFVSHLECGLRGDRYEADKIHGLPAAERPLLVRYNLDRLRKAVTKNGECAAACMCAQQKGRRLLVGLSDDSDSNAID